MLRLDGTYKISRLQIEAIPNSPTSTDAPRWIYPNFAGFLYPRGFRAFDQCFQTTGVNGTFDKDIAEDTLVAMRNEHPGRKWRLVAVTITQTTEVLT